MLDILGKKNCQDPGRIREANLSISNKRGLNRELFTQVIKG